MQIQGKNKESRRKSLIITAVISVLILLIVFNYTWEVEKPEPKIEIALLLEDEDLPEPPEEPIVPEPVKISSQNSAPSKSRAASNKNASATGKVNSSKYKHNPPIRSQVQNKPSPVDAAPNSQERDLGREEVKQNNKEPNKALNNLLNRRNQGGGSDGTSTNGPIRGSRTAGNGTGTGNGDGVIGEGGRKLISKIPGTMGDSRPALSTPCSASGSVHFKFSVSKSGAILSANRSGGSSDPCLVNTGISWIKKYVKANKGSQVATGTYTINFR